MRNSLKSENLSPRWDERRLEREAAAKAKEQQKPPVPPTKVGHKCLFLADSGLLEPFYLVFRLLAKNQKGTAGRGHPLPFAQSQMQWPEKATAFYFAEDKKDRKITELVIKFNIS